MESQERSCSAFVDVNGSEAEAVASECIAQWHHCRYDSFRRRGNGGNKDGYRYHDGDKVDHIDTDYLCCMLLFEIMEPELTIDLYEAIEQMKRISMSGGTFAMKFRKWNRQTRSGGDLVTVNAARLRPKASDERVDAASYKLFFTDTESGLARNCWQPLIMEFNGRRTVLN